MLRRTPLVLLLAGSVIAVPSGQLVSRDCYGSPDASCNVLLQNCVNSPGLWTSQSCLAAATCAGMGTFLNTLCCAKGQCLNPRSQASLDYNLYAKIVGQCAWASGGCPITQQNYIDFYYGSLSKVGSQSWPSSSAVVKGWWGSITSWAATGSSVPYKNFNDWLHYSSGTPTPPPAGGGFGGGGGNSGGGGGVIIVPPPPPGSGGGSGGGGSGGGGGGNDGGNNDGDDGDDDDDDDDDDDEEEEEEEFCEAEDTTGFKRDSFEDLYDNWAFNDTALGNDTLKRSAQIAWNYDIDCSVFPNICENWCYYVYCKGGTWLVHVDRNAGNRAHSDCKLPNKCSYNCKGTGGWSKNPNQNWQCDEQPKNTNTEGGAGAATRCMTAKENQDEGNKWRSFINQYGTGYGALPNGQAITVVLSNWNIHGICASYGGTGTTHCPAPVTPHDPQVQAITNGRGSDNGIRQA